MSDGSVKGQTAATHETCTLEPPGPRESIDQRHGLTLRLLEILNQTGSPKATVFGRSWPSWRTRSISTRSPSGCAGTVAPPASNRMKRGESSSAQIATCASRTSPPGTSWWCSRTSPGARKPNRPNHCATVIPNAHTTPQWSRCGPSPHRNHIDIHQWICAVANESCYTFIEIRAVRLG
jgi:hypothetical protein